MSRAFVKESDTDLIELPDRPVSRHPNLVTPAGLAAIEREVARPHAAHAAAVGAADKAAIAAAARELRYWSARRASAELVEPPAEKSRVQFGSTVTVQRQDGRTQTFRIVGEDEAAPAHGTARCRTSRRCRARCSARRPASASRSPAARWRFWRSGEMPRHHRATGRSRV